MVTTTVSITAFGAKGDGRTDNRAAIQKAIDFAKANGATVTVPTGVFLHRGMLTLDGVDMVGEGTGSVLKAIGASSSFDQQAINLRGNGASLKNLTLDSDATSRGYTGNSAKVQVIDATNFEVSGVTIKNSFGAGIITLNAGNGRIANNRIDSTNADSIHMTRKSHHIVVENNHITNGHDDGIAVVSYAGNNGPVNNITIRNNTVLDNQWGRNISVIGGENVTITRNYIEGNAAELAGIMVASEPRYNILGVKNVLVEANVVKNTGGYKTGQGAVMVYNGNTNTVEDVIIRGNEIIDAGKHGIFVRGNRIDDVTITGNLIHSAAAGPYLKTDGGTDVVYSGNTTSLTGWTALTNVGVQTGSPTVPTPTVPTVPAPVPEPTNPVITLYAAGNSFDGDAKFRLFADGVQVGADQTVQVQRGTGWQEFKLTLPTTSLPAKLSVEYFNDFYGGTGKDRNLELDRILVNGTTVDPGKLGEMFSNSTLTVDLSAGNAVTLYETAADPTPPPPPVAVTVYAAGDSYNGDARFRLLMDGKQIGTDQTVTVQRGEGWQAFNFTLPSGADPDRLSVQYLNDYYAGKGKDRNLEVDRMVVDGQTLMAPGGGELFTNGTLHFSVSAVI